MADPMTEIIHLHNHLASHDTYGSIEYSLGKLAEKGIKYYATTEHGTLHHVIRLLNAAKNYDINIIVGLEPYVEYNDQIYHITLLAKNKEGYYNLVRLNNKAKMRGAGSMKRNRSVVTIDDLIEFSENVIMLSGCPASPLQTTELDMVLVSRLKAAYGDDFYAEVQILGEDDKHALRGLQIAKTTGSKIVVTNDNHFILESDAKSHERFMRVIHGFAYDSSNNFCATADEIVARNPKLETLIREGIANTHEVLSKIEFFNLNAEPTLPEIPDAENILRKLVYEGLNEKVVAGLVEDNNETREQIEYELSVITDNHFASYFLLTKDILDYARTNKIKVGYGRGSAAGSIVSYLLGITQVNPKSYGLLFERFLNPSRIEMPDIDNDIASSGRKQVLEYANSKYGALQVAAFDTFGLRSTLTYGKKIGDFHLNQDDIIPMHEEDDYEGVKYAEFAKKYPDYDNFAKPLDGQIKNISRHAGGIVIVPDQEKDHIPLEQSPDGDLIAAFAEGQSGKDLALAGMVKFDVLGLTALDILQELEHTTGVEAPHPPIGDSVEFDIFRSGKTSGVFQFSGAGITRFTKEAHPTDFEDIIAINAVYRKGTLLGGTGELYKKVKTTGKPRLLGHAEIDKILKKTYGLIIYQEDVMKLYAWATDKDFAHADFARKTLVKFNKNNPKSVAAVEQLKQEMFDGMAKKGVSKKVQNELWSEIVTHSMYSFNRSHAVAYSFISWAMAWFKYHYPLDFYTVCLNYRSHEERQQFIFDIISEGYEISFPDVNISDEKFRNDGKKVFMPLSEIKGVGGVAVNEIISNRPFVSVEDMTLKCIKRALNKKVLSALYFTGALDSIISSDADREFLRLDDYTRLNYREVQQKYFDLKIPTKAIYDRVLEVLDKKYNNKNKYKLYAGVIADKELKNKTVYKYIVVPDGQMFFLSADDEHNKQLEVGDWILLAMNYRKIEKLSKL
jgi:DNA polymerase-3 subunit alpha